MALERGCIIIHQSRQVDYAPRIQVHYMVGALKARGVPVRRARLCMSDKEANSPDRALSPEARRRLEAFLVERPLSDVFLLRQFFPDTEAVVREVLPEARIHTFGESALMSPTIDEILEGREPTPPSPPDPSQPHWARTGDLPERFYRMVHLEGVKPDFEVEELTPELGAGMSGDLFLDQDCYYRAPYKGEEPALQGTSSCTFCAVPQALHRPGPPDLSVVKAQLEGQLARDPTGTVFHVLDSELLSHIVEFAQLVAEGPWEGLEFCSAIRVPHILRFRDALEEALPIFASKGHRYHIYNVGFESFAEAEWARLSKGYPLHQNLECIEYLDALQAEWPDNFAVRRWGSHGFIHVTPWTTFEDLRANLFYAQVIRLDELVSQFYLRRLRLYRQLPLYRLAKADGLLAEGGYDDWREDTAWRTGYDDEVVWRARDPRIDQVHRWAVRLILPESEQEHRWHSTLRDSLVGLEGAPWDLRVYAAVVDLIEEGVSDEDPEAFVQTLQLRAAGAVEDLFGHPTPARVEGQVPVGGPHARPDGASGRWSTWALEEAFLGAGAKEVIKREGPSGWDPAGTEAHLEAQGFVTRRVTVGHGFNIDVSTDAQGVRHPEAREIVLAARETDGLDRFEALLAEPQGTAEVNRKVGAMLGYPACCVEAHVTCPPGADRSDLHLMAHALSQTEGEVQVALDPYGPGARIEYFPCRLDCPESLARAQRLPAPEGPMPAVALHLATWASAWLFEVEAVDEGWRYGRVEANVEDPGLARLVAQLAEGDRLRWRPRLLYVYRGDKLLHVIPHATVVPIAYGVRNHLTRLSEVADLMKRPPPPAEGTLGPPAPERHRPERLPEVLGEACPGWRFTLASGGPAGWEVEATHEDGRRVALQFEADEGKPAFLREGGLTLSYALAEGDAFDESLRTLCEAVLAAATGDAALRDEVLAAV